MVIKGVGIDIVRVERIRRVYERFPEKFLNRLFTSAERQEITARLDPVPAIAARFAGKEAVVKALGSGIGPVSWRDVEFLQIDRGRPRVNLNGRAGRWAGSCHIKGVEVSWSHEREYAVAQAIAYGSLVPGRGFEGGEDFYS